jgi:hypothetical protein
MKCGRVTSLNGYIGQWFIGFYAHCANLREFLGGIFLTTDGHG